MKGAAEDGTIVALPNPESVRWWEVRFNLLGARLASPTDPIPFLSGTNCPVIFTPNQSQRDHP